MSGDCSSSTGVGANPSRTRTLTEHVVEYGREADLSVDTPDLRKYPLELFDGRHPDEYDETTRKAVKTPLDAHIYVIASPVYFRGISGSLKNLIDHILYEEFQKVSRTAGLVMTGRDRRHEHVLDAQLRSTIVYPGVDVATPSVFATETDFDEFTLTNSSTKERLEALVSETKLLHER